MLIRDATSEDTAQLLEIYRPFVVESAVSFETEPPSLEELTARVASVQAKWCWLVAQTDAGEIAGYAYATSFRAREAYRWSVETSAYVHPSHRGRGLGKLLYVRLLPILTGKGYCTAFASITLPNDASVALHRALGFEPVGVFRRAGWKFGRWHDVSCWQLALRDRPPEA